MRAYSVRTLAFTLTTVLTTGMLCHAKDFRIPCTLNGFMIPVVRGRPDHLDRAFYQCPGASRARVTATWKQARNVGGSAMDTLRIPATIRGISRDEAANAMVWVGLYVVDAQPFLQGNQLASNVKITFSQSGRRIASTTADRGIVRGQCFSLNGGTPEVTIDSRNNLLQVNYELLVRAYIPRDKDPYYDPVPEQPALLAPRNGERFVVARNKGLVDVTFRWRVQRNRDKVNHYEIFMHSIGAPEPVVRQVQQPQFTQRLGWGQEWEWKVRAANKRGQFGPWSQTRRLKTELAEIR